MLYMGYSSPLNYVRRWYEVYRHEQHEVGHRESHELPFHTPTPLIQKGVWTQKGIQETKVHW